MDTSHYETRNQIDEPIIKTYTYGSRVYGCDTPQSDFDYIVVVESDKDLYYSVEKPNMHFTVYSEPMFIKLIKEHKIHILECIFQQPRDNYLDYFELDTSKLRVAVSSVASNSFCKCKKKLRQEDYYIGKKSLFHSLRILEFGIQIANHGKIIDYSQSNHYLEEIMGMDSNEWNDFKDKFKPIFNKLKSEFKLVAPLEGEK